MWKVMYNILLRIIFEKFCCPKFKKDFKIIVLRCERTLVYA